MTRKKWLKTSFIFTLLIILSIGTFNYIVDPFHQYRVKTFYPIAYTSKLQRYINPGFAKNYDYDTVILGSSISENFIISDVKEILNLKKPIKLCISGTTAYEESLTLKTALENKKVTTVLYGLDTFLFRGKEKRTRHNSKTFPFYLYDKNIFNDYPYILSYDTTIKSIHSLTNVILSKKNSIGYNYNRMYQWQQLFTSKDFSINNVMREWGERGNIPIYKENNLKYYKKSFNYNFLDIFKKYPKTNFIIYFPPYSILYYKLEEERELFQNRLLFKKYVFETTKELSNIKIYDFQIAKEITHNLNNYHDLPHYHQRINKWILEQISKNEYRMNKENINSLLEKHQTQVKSYKVLKDNQ